MLDLRQFAALRAVAEHGSVLGAAAALGWSQPTVTHHLRALGLTTGLPVIDSSRAGTQLTSAGRLWLPHAIAILDRASRAEGDVAKTLADGRRRVRLGIFPTAAARVLPALVRALDSSGYSARVVEGELHELTLMMDQLALDAAIVFERPGDPAPAGPGVRRSSLFAERFTLIAPSGHPLANAGSRHLLEFSGEPWVFGVRETDPGISLSPRLRTPRASILESGRERTTTESFAHMLPQD